MKLRNKKTGEIGTVKVEYQKFYVTTYRIYPYNTLAELFEEWEDVPEEPKVGYIVDPMEELCVSADDSGYEESDVERAKELGIWFETKEEAERAVEKLKAFNRLKEAGLEFSGWDGYVSTPDGIGNGDHFDCCGFVNIYGKINGTQNDYSKYRKDLDLLFGGEK